MIATKAFPKRDLGEERSGRNNLHRWLDAKVGRWINHDPIGFAAGDQNLYRYVGNSATNYIDPLGFDIVLGIHSNQPPDGKFAGGHAWLSVHDTDKGTTNTYGLWPDFHPDTIDNREGTDVRKNMEKKSSPNKYNRYQKLTPKEEKKLKTFLSRTDHWRHSHTCAAWASQGFRETTREDIDADDYFGFETPRELSRNIVKKEKNDPTSTAKPGSPPQAGGDSSVR